MASNYGPSFGFRRSDESMQSGTEGRFRVPDTGTYLIGDVVEIDDANPGYVKKSAADAPIVPGVRGLLVQESAHIEDLSMSPLAALSGTALEQVRNGETCAIWTGAGLKVWYRNRAAVSAATGRPARPARTVVDVAAMTLGGMVAWDGSKFVGTADATAEFGRVTNVSGTGDSAYAEIVLAKSSEDQHMKTTARTFLHRAGVEVASILALREEAGISSDDYKARMEELNREAAELLGDPTWMREVAAVIVEQVTYGFQSLSVLDGWFDVRNPEEFESVVITETRGIEAFWTHRGGVIDESQLDRDGFTLPRDTIGFAVSEMEDKLRANFGETLEQLIVFGRAKVAQEVDRRVLTTALAAVPVGSYSDIDATGTGLTAAVLNSALDAVMDEPLPDGAQPQMPTILGRATALGAISDFAGFAPTALEEIRLRGQLGIYRGANVRPVRNFQDAAGQPFLPADRVFVMTGSVGTLAHYGPFRSRFYVENTRPYAHAWARRDVGVAVYRPKLMRVIRL